jgi:hypothetical protein
VPENKRNSFLLVVYRLQFRLLSPHSGSGRKLILLKGQFTSAIRAEGATKDSSWFRRRHGVKAGKLPVVGLGEAVPLNPLA